jgi:GAF domain-containing protein
MERNVSPRFACVVCGLETPRHRGWYLAVENQWTDRIKILAWHPILARQASMQSVCGEQHLKTLLAHWLTHANLRLMASVQPETRPPEHSAPLESDSMRSIGKLVGELAVHRESLSRVWTGSPQALDCILNELVRRAADEARITGFASMDTAVPSTEEIVMA